jgi:protein arginine N-methyltransferase 1
MRIEYHRTMLADRVRNAAFHRALQASVVPGKSIVCDIGCGTGLLGFMAARLGAKRVYLLETAEIVQVANLLAHHNEMTNIEIVPAHSTEVDPPERMDLVVSETLGNYPFEENIIETLADARKRYLKPDGRLIPAGVTQYVAPVVAPRFHAELSIWDGVGFGLDFEPAKIMGFNNIYVRTFQPADLLDAGRTAVAWDAVRFADGPKTGRSGTATFKLKEPATVSGLALWWSAELAEGIAISTAPDAPKTHWEQLYLPALEPIEIPVGGSLNVRLRSTTSYKKGTNVTWMLLAHDAKGTEITQQALDLDKGFVP